jgi:putative addiction module antidote
MAASVRTKVRRIGGSLGVILSKTVLDEMSTREGDELTVIQTEDGLLLTPYDEEFERTMESYAVVKNRYRNALRELAK